VSAAAIIEAQELGRWYGPVVGLSDLSVNVPPGVTGLVGPNGAGKSTLLKLIAGELRPSRGAVKVLGQAPFANRELYRRLGFAPQQDALYGHLSGLEFVSLLLQLGGFSRKDARSRAASSLERVGLGADMSRRTRGYSKGMRQRTKLAQAIAHEPELLIVDEPLTGLDPLGRRELLALFAEMGEAGTSILLSSHVLHEVESLTQEVILLHRGRLLAQGGVGEIRTLLSRHPRRVTLVAREPRALARLLVEREEASALAIDGRRLSVETSDLPELLRALTPIAAAERVGLEEIQSPDASLEAVFDYLVG